MSNDRLSDSRFPIIDELGSGAIHCSEHGYVPAALTFSHVIDHAARMLPKVRAQAEQQEQEQARLAAARPPDAPEVIWRQEDGTDGLVDVPTIEGRDVACLARTSDPRMLAAGLPWALTHGPNYSHESYFKTRDDAMLFVVLKARELRDVLETGNA